MLFLVGSPPQGTLCYLEPEEVGALGVSSVRSNFLGWNRTKNDKAKKIEIYFVRDIKCYIYSSFA